MFDDCKHGPKNSCELKHLDETYPHERDHEWKEENAAELPSSFLIYGSTHVISEQAFFMFDLFKFNVLPDVDLIVPYQHAGKDSHI